MCCSVINKCKVYPITPSVTNVVVFVVSHASLGQLVVFGVNTNPWECYICGGGGDVILVSPLYERKMFTAIAHITRCLVDCLWSENGAMRVELESPVAGDIILISPLYEKKMFTPITPITRCLVDCP